MMSRSTASRLSTRMMVATLGGVLVVGVIIGSLLARAASSSTGGNVTTEDYILLVADLYQREGSVFNARERLAAQGIDQPAATVADLAKWYRAERPTATAAIASLDQLADALQRLDESTAPPADGGSSPSSVNVMNFVPLVIVFVLGVLGFVVARTKGPDLVRIISRQLDRLTAGRSKLRPRTVFSTSAPSAAFTNQRPERSAGSVDVERSDDAEPSSIDDFEELDDLLEARPIVRPLKPTPDLPTPDLPPRPRPVVSSSQRTRYAFRFDYQLGDEDYEELRPIRRRSDDLLGTCCLSAALASESDGGVYGFIAWIHDYESQEIRSAGLVTAWALSHDPEKIERWMEEAVVDERIVLDRGASVELVTQNLSATFEVVECELLEGEPHPPVTRLNVRAEVVNRQLVAAANGR